MVRGASDTRPTSHAKGWLASLDDVPRVNTRHIDSDVDLVRAKLDEEAFARERSLAEAASIVTDEVQRSKALNDPGDDVLAVADEVYRPDLHSC